MKRVIFMCALIAMSVISSYVSAQKELGIFNSLSVGVSAGTTGIGVDVATPVTPHFAIRGGVSFMPGIKISTDVDVELNSFTYSFNSSLWPVIFTNLEPPK